MTRTTLILLLAASAALAAPDDRRIVAEAEIDAPPAEVWRLFTTREGVTSWMVPVAEVDLRVGGHMKTNYRKDGAVDDANAITNAILAYDPERMLCLQNTKAPAGFPHAEGARGTWSVIYFDPLPDGRTRVRVVGLGWPEGPKGDAARAFFERGNAYTLERLQQRVKTGAPLPF